MTPMVAQVTTATGARLHLDNAGNAHCGAGNGRTIATTARPLADATPELLCRRCIKAIRAAADTAIASHAGGGQSQYRVRSIEPLRRVREAIRTDAEKVAAEAFQAKFARIVAQAPAREYKPSAFALIRQAHADANQKYRDEQLALAA